MTQRYMKSSRRLAAAAVLGFALSGCNFINPTEGDPNTVPSATLDQLFVASQVALWFFQEADMSRFSAVWMQQMDGTDRQFSGFSTYEVFESTFNVPWERMYTDGSLVDIKRAIALAEEAGRRPYAGILKLHMAFYGLMGASVYGDIPWSQAANPEFTEPQFDEQFSVFGNVIALIDTAIGDLGGSGAGPAGTDFNFAGDAGSWIRVANSLKARAYMHMAEVDGSSAYSAALAAANQGISDVSDNWTAQHSSTTTENSIWNQFNRERTAYISAGKVGVDLLQDAGDPRLQLYFTRGSIDFSDVYIGSPPGEDDPNDPGPDASQLNTTTGLPGAVDYSFPIVTCSETQFIIAEASLALGDAAGAAAALADGIECQEDIWSLTVGSIPRPSVLAMDPGILASSTAAQQDLLTHIMEQKYNAQFLNPEVWNDYKRTCLPALTGWRGEDIPGRFIYPEDERQTNPNTPTNPLRNDNDPQAC
jgi:hypothetical protein